MSVRKQLANLTRRALRTLGVRAVSKTIRGAPVRIPIAMGALRSLLFDPTYSPFFNEDDVFDSLEAKLRPTDVVFDIGAYHGVWAVLLARRVQTVVAFEPNRGTFEVLTEVLAVNGCRNVIPSMTAIGDEAHMAELWGSGSGASLKPGDLRKSASQVRVETLDGFAESNAITPDVLKIDVEGAEYQVLSGGSRCLQHARVVCIEVHFDELPKFGADYRKVESLMTAAGFAEVMRSRPERNGAADESRMHVIFERAL